MNFNGIQKSTYAQLDENQTQEILPQNLKPIQVVKKYSKTLFIISLFTAFLTIVSIVIAYSKNSNHGFGTSTKINSPPQSPFDGLIMNGFFTIIDTKANSFISHYSVSPSGTLLDTNDDLQRSPRGPVSLMIDSKTEKFPANQIMNSLYVTLPFTEGNAMAYPFDEYRADFIMSATWLNPDSSNTTGLQKIPLSLKLTSNAEGWQIVATLDDVSHKKSNIIMVNLVFYRGPAQRFFSIFLSGIMWLLGGSVFSLAVTLCLRKRKVEPPTIAVATTMLFALPAVRNVQPGSPPIGCIADFMAFFWTLALVAAASLILILNYIKMYKADKPAENEALNEAQDFIQLQAIKKNESQFNYESITA